MPTCSYCALTYQHSLMYCPNCGTDNAPPPIQTKQKPIPRAQNIPAPQQIQYIPQPQVIYVKQKRFTGIDLLVNIIGLLILTVTCVWCIAPGFLLSFWSSKLP